MIERTHGIPFAVLLGRLAGAMLPPQSLATVRLLRETQYPM